MAANQTIRTPARWVFDDGSKTKTGYSLKDILTKGAMDMIKMVNMGLSWRIRRSAITGDIQMFYNSIFLFEDY